MDDYVHEGMRFPVLDAGPGDGEVVVLLHGFPQTAHAWSRVAPTLHGAGLRTLAPETRGTAPGARPRGRSAYRVEHLAGDVVALLDAAELPSVHLVGHDWGGGIAWAVAGHHQERVRSLTVLSTPHSGAMAWAARHSDQGLKSWYMTAFQTPVLPEHLIAAVVRRFGMRGLGLPRDHERAYADRFGDAQALAGALGPYRALLTRAEHPLDLDRPVAAPTTYVWGRRDRYLGRAAAERTAQFCTGDYRFVEVDADHWLPEKHPDLVAREILARVRSVTDR